jgi:TM2 domain-containing membrane protein YozV|tara:strand:+ start:331 stop:765 length:435 start_codon:yes stop_codon:yes gene_type:complete
MYRFTLMFNRLFLFSITLSSIILCQSQEVDSLSQKSPKIAALRSFMFPGGGQFYNGQPVKGSILASTGIASGYLYMDFSKKYSSSNGLSSKIKKDYLYQRNRYGWWVIIVYIYGLLDAVVEAHLHPFNKVMNEDLEKSDQEVLE